MTEFYDMGRQLGDFLRGLVGPPGVPAPTPELPPELLPEAAAPDVAEEPLRPTVIALLTALAEQEESPTSELLPAAASVSGGVATIGAGTLHRSLQRMRVDGLIEETDGVLSAEERASLSEDPDLEARLTYRITDAGREALQGQASQLAALSTATARISASALQPTGSARPGRRKPRNPGMEEWTGILPHVIVADANAAAEFYAEAFDADELWRDVDADGRVWQSELLIGGTRIALASEFAGMRLVSPSQEGNSLILHHYVPDVNGAFVRAVNAGATPLLEPMDTYWGDRYSQVQDPFGHRWALASRRTDPSPAEMRRSAQSFRERNPDIAVNPPM